MAKRWAHKYEYSAQIEQRAFDEAIKEATKRARKRGHSGYDTRVAQNIYDKKVKKYYKRYGVKKRSWLLTQIERFINWLFEDGGGN